MSDELMTWQPIETAPKTTLARLAWCPDRENIYVVTWRFDCWIHFGGRGGELSEVATHWMPLPKPPSEERTP